VLFLCYNNAGRSLMAEAFFNTGAEKRGIQAQAESAGLLGVGAISQMVAKCMEEVDVSLEGLKPKQVTKELIEWADTVIAFGLVNSDHSSIKFSVTEDWPIEDCAGLAYGRLCKIRDEISGKVDELLDRLAT